MFALVHVDVDEGKMSDQECASSQDSAEKPPHPFYILDGGP